MESIFIVTAVAGATEFVKRLHLKDYFAAIIIALAALIGGLAGLFHVDGVADAWTGIIIGLSASGLITVASKVNTKVTR